MCIYLRIGLGEFFFTPFSPLLNQKKNLFVLLRFWITENLVQFEYKAVSHVG